MPEDWIGKIRNFTFYKSSFSMRDCFFFYFQKEMTKNSLQKKENNGILGGTCETDPRRTSQRPPGTMICIVGTGNLFGVAGAICGPM